MQCSACSENKLSGTRVSGKEQKLSTEKLDI